MYKAKVRKEKTAIKRKETAMNLELLALTKSPLSAPKIPKLSNHSLYLYHGNMQKVGVNTKKDTY